MRKVYQFKGKIERSSILRRLKVKVLRLFRADLSFQDSLLGQNRIAHESPFVGGHHDSWREIRRAMLDAERQRAMVLVERQKHPRLY